VKSERGVVLLSAAVAILGILVVALVLGFVVLLDPLP
jgi:hypothetical protein